MTMRVALTLFVLAVLAAGASVLLSAGQLPERVASHFGAGGDANGFMSRRGYTVFMLIFTVGLPVFIVAMVGGLPRLMTTGINIPNRNYWLAPERRAATANFLTLLALWMGGAMALFVAAIHALVVRANEHEPARLANGPFLTLLGLYLAGTAVWVAVLLRRFGRVP